MTPMRGFCVVLCISATLTRALVAEEPPNAPAQPELRRTQVSILLESDSQRSRFQGTVLAKERDRLTVLTAAHCVGDGDIGKVVRIGQGQQILRAQVAKVVQNPFFRAARFGDSPGADNAIAQFAGVSEDDQESGLYRRLQTAEISKWALPDPNGRPIKARILDQDGAEHDVRAGNFSNPKWLEWGPTYRPRPGDSGSGVFVYPRTTDGTSRPVLIGVVVDRSELGGGASLLSRRLPWVDAAAQLPSPN
jgi:hypothetical protein